MAADFLGIALGFFLFSLITVSPGYAIAYGLNVFDFRERSWPGRLAIAVSLSISLTPLLSFLLGNVLSLSALWVVYGFFACASIAVFISQRRSAMRRNVARPSWTIVAIAFGWLALALFSLADWQFDQRLYYSVTSFDTCIRAAITSAIATFGIPAQSPFFFPGQAVPLRYHYLWLIQPALVKHVSAGLLDARQCYIAGGLWCCLGLLSTLALYLRFFSPLGGDGLHRRIVRSWLLLGVTGLDILPASLFLVLTARNTISLLPPSVEWWNEQVDGWVYTMLWEPHYLAGLIACLTGFLLLWVAAPKGHPANSWTAVLLAGWAFASAVGSSIYIAFVFAVFLGIWCLITLWRQWFREFAALLFAGLTALALSLPFLHTLRGPGSGGKFLQFTIRPFLLGEVIMKSLGIASGPALAFSNLLLLPLNYFLELGFFFAVAVLMLKSYSRKKILARHELALCTMTAVSVAICTFVRSGVIDHNDLGWRGFLVAQFALLLAAVEFWSTGVLRRARLLSVLLALGAAGTTYDVLLLRLYPVLSDRGMVPKIAWLSRDENLGRRTYANRDAYEWLRAHSDRRAVIQGDPHPVIQDVFFGLYADRRTAAEDSGCVTPFGGDPVKCQTVIASLEPLFSPSARGDEMLAEACASLSVDFFVAKDTDPAWKNSASWVWKGEPIFANDYVRVFSCRHGFR